MCVYEKIATTTNPDAKSLGRVTQRPFFQEETDGGGGGGGGQTPMPPPAPSSSFVGRVCAPMDGTGAAHHCVLAPLLLGKRDVLERSPRAPDAGGEARPNRQGVTDVTDVTFGGGHVSSWRER